MDDIRVILKMSDLEINKHEYLKYRVKRLEQIYPWMHEQCRKIQMATMAGRVRTREEY